LSVKICAGAQNIWKRNSSRKTRSEYDLMNRVTGLHYKTSGSQLLAQYKYTPGTNGQWKAATEIQLQPGTTYWEPMFQRSGNEECAKLPTRLKQARRPPNFWVEKRDASLETQSHDTEKYFHTVAG